MRTFTVREIGTIKKGAGQSIIWLYDEYRPAMTALDSFSHIIAVYWLDKTDNDTDRTTLEINSPYKKGPKVVGSFATRNAARPNPIGIASCKALEYDMDTGCIRVENIDAPDGTPVLDIKPYTPSFDMVLDYESADWCSEWPKNIEEAANFDWSDVFSY